MPKIMGLILSLLSTGTLIQGTKLLASRYSLYDNPDLESEENEEVKKSGRPMEENEEKPWRKRGESEEKARRKRGESEEKARRKRGESEEKVRERVRKRANTNA
jgi:hypothetical protein